MKLLQLVPIFMILMKKFEYDWPKKIHIQITVTCSSLCVAFFFALGLKYFSRMMRQTLVKRIPKIFSRTWRLFTLSFWPMRALAIQSSGRIIARYVSHNSVINK